MTTTHDTTDRPDFAAILQRAISEAGRIHAAYTAFHNYSFGNQLLAMEQCHARRLPLGPLASFAAWKAKGRYVKRGEKAIWLWMPIAIKRHVTDDETGEEHDELRTSSSSSRTGSCMHRPTAKRCRCPRCRHGIGPGRSRRWACTK
jgi:N-terminal domain of anti-restriction factor ArdC